MDGEPLAAELNKLVAHLRTDMAELRRHEREYLAQFRGQPELVQLTQEIALYQQIARYADEIGTYYGERLDAAVEKRVVALERGPTLAQRIQQDAARLRQGQEQTPHAQQESGYGR
jgi:hypothetical protein